MKIVPVGQEAPVSGVPLKVTKTKRSEMVAKAKELLTEPREFKVLMDELEQFYILTHNEHYTSDQLKDVINQVQVDVRPEPVPLEVLEA